MVLPTSWKFFQERTRKSNAAQRTLPSRAPSTALLGGLHVGRYGAPGGQALEALVCVIDEDPVFALVVRLRVITCGHCGL